jgi:hypothetical protein
LELRSKKRVFLVCNAIGKKRKKHKKTGCKKVEKKFSEVDFGGQNLLTGSETRASRFGVMPPLRGVFIGPLSPSTRLFSGVTRAENRVFSLRLRIGIEQKNGFVDECEKTKKSIKTENR